MLNTFIEPDTKPHRLIDLSSRNKSSLHISLSILKLRDKINKGLGSEITPVEWIWCISNEQSWQELSSKERLELSVKIWETSLRVKWLFDSLICRLAWFYSGKSNTICKYIQDGFKSWINLKNIPRNLSLELLIALGGENPKKQLAEITFNQNLTPSELGDRVKSVFPSIPIFREYISEIAPCFIKQDRINNDTINWLLRCLDEMQEQYQISSVDFILINISTEIAIKFPLLVAWLKKNYNSHQKQSSISLAARQNFRNLIGAINYSDFRDFVDLIIKNIPLGNNDEKQLRNRQLFWSNYSNSFMRIKILLPEQTYTIISNKFREDQDIVKLEDDGSNPTELCIFDLGNKGYIIEFFRGLGSEIRFFKKDTSIEKILFEDTSLSLQKIRSLGGEIHDHVYCWQSVCEKWLRKELDIVPNVWTKFFTYVDIHYVSHSSKKSNKPILKQNMEKRIEEKYLPYTYGYGLQELTNSQQKRREQSLYEWNATIRKLSSN